MTGTSTRGATKSSASSKGFCRIFSRFEKLDRSRLHQWLPEVARRAEDARLKAGMEPFPKMEIPPLSTKGGATCTSAIDSNEKQAEIA